MCSSVIRGTKSIYVFSIVLIWIQVCWSNGHLKSEGENKTVSTVSFFLGTKLHLLIHLMCWCGLVDFMVSVHSDSEICPRHCRLLQAFKHKPWGSHINYSEDTQETTVSLMSSGEEHHWSCLEKLRWSERSRVKHLADWDTHSEQALQHLPPDH